VEQVSFDVLVIGGGLAAIRAAVAACAAGARTGMVLKGVLGKSGSSAIAGGGLAAVLGGADAPDDNLDKHYHDTLVSGDFVNDPDLVRRLVSDAPRATRELEAMGARFVRNNISEIELFLAPAHTEKRSVRVAGGGTARLMGPLTDYVKRQPIALLEHTTVLDLMRHEGRAAGALALREGKPLLLLAKAIVLASGGAGRIYPLTSNMAESTGDGYAMALRAGLALTGMEFVQFTPTALAYPKALEGASTGGVLLGLPGTRLWNSQQERFMERYDAERKEASTRAILSRAFQSEIVAGRGSPHGGVWLDLTRNDADVLERLAAPFMKSLAPHGIDIRRDPIEIAPAVHYFMGGVEINALAETALPGLYAAGEVTGGVQGSNRLSSNSLTDVNVFGAIAGREAAEYLFKNKYLHNISALEKQASRALHATLDEKSKPAAQHLAALHAELKRVMFAGGGIVRERDAMRRGLADIGAVRAADLRQHAELRNMLDTGEAVIRGALLRTESRGAHYRADFPEKNDAAWRAVTRVYAHEGVITAIKGREFKHARPHS
jgi:fumarate reductase (CoM/CoB) subunit A